MVSLLEFEFKDSTSSRIEITMNLQTSPYQMQLCFYKTFHFLLISLFSIAPLEWNLHKQGLPFSSVCSLKDRSRLRYVEWTMYAYNQPKYFGLYFIILYSFWIFNPTLLNSHKHNASLCSNDNCASWSVYLLFFLPSMFLT